MRPATILAALAATFNSALADVVCNPETLHFKPRMISVAERDGFSNIINEVCSNTVKKSVQEHFKSTIFSRSCTEDTFSEDECKANFQFIIEACVAGKNAGGGSLATNGLTVEVQLDSSNNEVGSRTTAKERRATKPKPPTKPKLTKPKPTKPKPKPKPTKPKPSNKDSKKPEKPITGKTCSLKPGKGKGTGNGKSNEGKKKPTKVVRDLLSKLFRRAGSEGKKSSDYGSDCSEGMADGGDWGLDTWRGIRWEISSTMSSADLLAIAKSAYEEVQSKRGSRSGIVVAALFVPEGGVFIGTPAHGTGTAKVKEFAEAEAPELWKILGPRKPVGNNQGSLYHAEDIAMLYAIETGAVKGDSKFPAGSMMATWGKVGDMPAAKKMPPCSTGKSITVTCKAVLKDMRIAEA